MTLAQIFTYACYTAAEISINPIDSGLLMILLMGNPCCYHICYNDSNIQDISAPFIVIGGQMENRSMTDLELIKENSLLKQRIRELEQSEIEHKQAEATIKEYSHVLQERVKELGSFYTIVGVVDKPDGTLEDIFEEIVNILPQAWQYPEIACGRITRGAQEFRTGNFKETPFKQASNITVRGNRVGTVEIFYLEERQECEEGPFLKDERKLIDAVAGRLGKLIEQMAAEETVRESESKFRAVAESSSTIFFIIQNEKYVYVNPAFTTITGYTFDDLSSMNFWDVISPDMRELVRARGIARQKRDDVPSRYDLKFITKSGEEKYGSFGATFIEYDGRPAMLGSVVDITERKKMEVALRQSEEKYRCIFENAVEGIYHTTLEGLLVDVNMTFAKMFGYGSPEEAVNDITDIASQLYVDPDDRARAVKCLSEKGRLDGFECPVRRKNGHIFWVTLNARLTYLLENTPCIEGFVVDITERKQAAEELRESQRRLADIIEFLPDATLAIDQEGRVIAWNRAIELMTGVKKEDMLGKGNYEHAIPFYGTRRPILINFVSMWDEDIERQYSFITKEGDTLFTETDVPFVRGRHRVLWGKASPLYDARGNVVGAIESIRDITDRKRAEEVLVTNETRYRALFENANDAIFLMRDQRIIDCNTRALEIFKCARQQIVNETPYRFSPLLQPDGTDSKEKVLERIRAAIDGYPQLFAWKHCSYDGAPFDTEVSLNRIVLNDGTLVQAIVRDITERKRYEEKLEKLVLELQEAHAEVKILSGFLPICASCKKIRNDKGYWEQMEMYIRDHSEAEFSHGICPECAEKLYSEYYHKK